MWIFHNQVVDFPHLSKVMVIYFKVYDILVAISVLIKYYVSVKKEEMMSAFGY